MLIDMFLFGWFVVDKGIYLLLSALVSFIRF